MHPDSSDPRAIVSLPSGGTAQLLFLLLHGDGGQAAAMLPLAQALRLQYPQSALVSLNAPQTLGGPDDTGAGYQWFSPIEGAEAERAELVGAALPDFIARVRGWAAHFGLDWPQVALAGFAEGATLALEAVQAEPRLAGRVIAIGGGHASLPQHAPQEVCLHLLHGMADTVQPYPPVVAAAQALVRLGADVTADIKPGVGHELHPELVTKAMEQLRTFVPARLWREAVIAAVEQDRAGS
jgi:phospholipase/carboxylesterase